MKSIGESVKFAWEETSKLDTNPIHRSTVFIRGLGRMARMRAALVAESLVDESYTPLSDDTEEYNIQKMLGTSSEVSQ